MIFLYFSITRASLATGVADMCPYPICSAVQERLQNRQIGTLWKIISCSSQSWSVDLVLKAAWLIALLWKGNFRKAPSSLETSMNKWWAQSTSMVTSILTLSSNVMVKAPLFWGCRPIHLRSRVRWCYLCPWIKSLKLQYPSIHGKHF